MENKGYEIVVRDLEKPQEELKLTTSFDSDIYDWGYIFKSILMWLTFSGKQAEELINDKYEEYENAN